MALDFSVARPRLVATLPLAAATVLSLKAAIIAALSTNNAVRDLFADAVVADQAARLASTETTPGYVVYQTDTTTFYLLTTGADPTVNGNWTALAAAANVRALHSFLRRVSWNIARDSSIGNLVGGNAMYYMNKFAETQIVPLVARMTTYGVPIAVDTERSVSGCANDIFVYSLSGTSLVLDLIFEPGS